MFFKKKEKPIKLGQINAETGVLEKYSKSISWDLDYTVTHFLIGALKEYRKVKNGYPVFLLNTYSNEEDAMAQFDKIIACIIDDLEYCNIDTQDLLSEDERKILKNHLSTMSCKDGKITFGPRTKEIEKIYEHEIALKLDQERRFKRAFELLGEWLPHFWW